MKLMEYMTIYSDSLLVLVLQIIVAFICRVLKKDIRKEIEYNLMRIRAGARQISRRRAICLSAEYIGISICLLMFILLICANAYRLISYIY